MVMQGIPHSLVHHQVNLHRHHGWHVLRHGLHVIVDCKLGHWGMLTFFGVVVGVRVEVQVGEILAETTNTLAPGQGAD